MTFAAVARKLVPDKILLLFSLSLSVCTCLVISSAHAVDLADVAQFHAPQAEHCDQLALLAIPDAGSRFAEAFECGDELFDTRFNALDGVGANVGDNLRFTRVPRADKTGPGEWASHFPRRATGPNAEACTVCHIDPFEDGAGLSGVNVVRDPLHSGDVGKFIQRNTPHLFGEGARQLLAEEMTVEMRRKAAKARALSCSQGTPVTIGLTSKGVNFGTVRVTCNGNDDTSKLTGLDADLIVKPFQRKGNTRTLRQFNRDAANNELGMQPVEAVGDGADGDGDGVTNELGIGDMTAMAVYVAAQPRPVTKLELSALGLLKLTRQEAGSIRRGDAVFNRTGCAECHRPVMTIDDPVFTEPGRVSFLTESTFPAGQDAAASGVSAATPVSFNLTTDHPDNRIVINGETVTLGSFEKTRNGGALVRLYGDLKRHEMGPELAENIDETGTGASTWLTTDLWGAGSTAPYLHDGRATTLTEAILAHGGEAQASRDRFVALNNGDRADVIAFLDNLVLYKVIEEDPVEFNHFPRRPRSADRGHGTRR